MFDCLLCTCVFEFAFVVYCIVLFCCFPSTVCLDDCARLAGNGVCDVSLLLETVRTHTHTHTHTHLSTHMLTYTHIQLQTHTHTHTYLPICLRTRISNCKHTHTHTHRASATLKAVITMVETVPFDH